MICRDISSETMLNVLTEPQLYFEIDEICIYLGSREVPEFTSGRVGGGGWQTSCQADKINQAPPDGSTKIKADIPTPLHNDSTWKI